MNLQPKIRTNLESLIDSFKAVAPIAGLLTMALILYGTAPRRNYQTKSESAPTPIEQSCNQSNPNYPFMSVSGGDEYSEGVYMDIRDKIDFLFKGDTNLPFETDMIPVLRRAPEKAEPKNNQPNYDRKSPVRKYTGNKLVNRKVKNNNPCNLKAVPGKNWAGQIGVDHRGFAIFKNELYGLRSWLKNAGDLRDRYGTDTISELITKCSPPHENDTNSYINFVAENIGISPNEKLDLTNKEQAVKLLASVTHRESSAQYPRQTLEQAYAMLYR